MIIENIRIDQFRNYQQQEIIFHPGTNVFIGDNAQGKTNILESVYVCGTTKSHRATKDKDMIRFGCEEAHIRMNIRKKDIPYRIDMHLKKNKAKGIAVNGVPIRKASELLGLGSFVFFSPEDLNIIKNGPAERRRFMDMQLCQLSRIYVQNLSSYNRSLMQRNSLLKDISFHPEYESTLEIWDEQLVTYGRKVIEARNKLISSLSEIIVPIHEKLSGGREHLKIIYDQNVSADHFAEELRSNKNRDIRMKMTLCGPHRDDLIFLTDDIDIRKFGSQGQQRTTALSLKLSEIELVKKESGESPILLLDDVLSELDGNRQRFLLESIDHVQTLITCTGVEDFTENHFRIDKLFCVKNGMVQEDSNG